MRRLLLRWVNFGVLPTDTEEQRIQKATLTIISTLGVLIALAVGIAVALAGTLVLPLFAYVPLILINAIIFVWRKNFVVYCTVILTFTLIGPFIAQWYMGGFAASGANSVWCMLVPFGAQIFMRSKSIVRWQIAVVLCTVLSVAAEILFPPPPSSVGATTSLVLAAINISVVSTMSSYSLLRVSRQREQAAAALAEEHRRSEALLLNILPESIAERLKRSPALIADRHASSTILFADIVGFTPLSSAISPEELVMLLNQLFSDFDVAVERRGLEKIKTIGDAYMVAGGVPLPRDDHALAVVDLGLEMLAIVARHQAGRAAGLAIRIGISSGPVVAGVLGKRKFIYDLWGDTVNTASRMESHGPPGVIHLSEDTHRLIQHKYACEQLGPINVKGKGMMTTYVLRAAAPEAQGAARLPA